MPNRVPVDVLPPTQAALAAALGRAFHAPAANEPCPFSDLLRRID